MSAEENLYVVVYDIADPARWRQVFKTMKGFGAWLQLSVFQCRLGRQRHAEMVAMLDQIIDHAHDHVVVMDLGNANQEPRVISLGKRGFEPVERRVAIV